MIKSPVSDSVIEGASKSFSCYSSGNPQPNITWIFNNDTLALANNQESIQLSAIGLANSGFYYCIFQNAAGVTRSSIAKLIVKSKSMLDRKVQI